uniref:Uncharacterized protein n=1 Tax=Nelumbo nucifera TaxID=4432 RepID=A0A822XPG1_NELNU|nr:TPA_asm: hypothetical protein HUJ06_022088 [Nelumbo nucifera]
MSELEDNDSPYSSSSSYNNGYFEYEYDCYSDADDYDDDDDDDARDDNDHEEEEIDYDFLSGEVERLSLLDNNLDFFGTASRYISHRYPYRSEDYGDAVFCFEDDYVDGFEEDDAPGSEFDANFSDFDFL